MIFCRIFWRQTTSIPWTNRSHFVSRQSISQEHFKLFPRHFLHDFVLDTGESIYAITQRSMNSPVFHKFKMQWIFNYVHFNFSCSCYKVDALLFYPHKPYPLSLSLSLARSHFILHIAHIHKFSMPITWANPYVWNSFWFKFDISFPFYLH